MNVGCFFKMADAVGALATLESSSVFGSGGCSNSSARCSDAFDMCDDSGSEAATPDMESQVLFVKLKEVSGQNIMLKSLCDGFNRVANYCRTNEYLWVCIG